MGLGTAPLLEREKIFHSRDVEETRTAMDLLQRASSKSVIALWLGHESIETTQIYLEANLELKERMLAKTTPPGGVPGRYRPDDALQRFLNAL